MSLVRQCLSVLALLVSAACTGLPSGVEPVRPFDLQRYKGEWFEIMRLDHSFERGLTNVTATYVPRDDGSVRVINRGFDPKTCRWREAEGRATFLGPSTTGSLSVTFFWPFAGGYHVFALDQEDYAWAVVAGPSTDYLWILARRPDLGPETRDRLVDKARRLGFPVQELILVDQGKPECQAPRASGP